MENARPEFEVENRSALKAYLELLRLPNVFTAMADILLGYLFTHPALEPKLLFGLLLGSSSLLYLSGMVLNDYFDGAVDARDRPGRPIPSGRVSASAAWAFGLALMIGGLACAGAATLIDGSWRPAIIAALLALAIFTYNRVLKNTPLAPLVMGACRFLNVLLGLSVSPNPWQTIHYVLAAGVGAYIVGVTIFARTEAKVSGRPQLLLGTAVMLFGIGILAWYPSLATDSIDLPIVLPDRWYLAWALLALLVGWRCLYAAITPTPQFVQAAVKNAIIALIMLDAVALLAVHDVTWSLLILILWIPTVTLGRFIYST